MESALLGSLGTLGIFAGYALVKRFSRSNCHGNSGCLECDSPAIEMQKQQTERIDSLYDMIKKLQPDVEQGPVSPNRLLTAPYVDNRVSTKEVVKVDNN